MAFSDTGCPRVSVIIPAYNVAEYVAETLDSVFAQTFSDYEVIVVNDGSPDTEHLERVLDPYRHRICYLWQENQGAGPARNAGLQQARSELVAFLDGDDVWLPDYLASQVTFLEEHGYDLVYSDAWLIPGSPKGEQRYMQGAPSDGEANFESLLDLRCNVLTSGTVARKQAILDVGMFERGNYRGQDFNLWLRMARNGARFGYQRKVLLKYRVRRDGLSGDAQQQLQRAITGYQRIASQIELEPAEQEIVKRRLIELEAQLALEHGKALLLNKDFAGARAAIAEAVRQRPSTRLVAIQWMLRLAPGVLLRFYRIRGIG